MFDVLARDGMEWSILDELESLQEEMNRMFSDFGHRWAPRNWGRYPPVNVWSSGEGLIVDAELPGADPEGIDVSVQAGELVLRGKLNGHEAARGERYYRRERPYGEFVRKLRIPFRADAAGVKACYKNGVLRVTVPRLPEDKPRKISVQTG